MKLKPVSLHQKESSEENSGGDEGKESTEGSEEEPIEGASFPDKTTPETVSPVAVA